MADVTLTYKGSDILELSDSGSATLKTGGKYCEDDIALEYVKPSGGGSPWELIADYTSDENADVIEVELQEEFQNENVYKIQYQGTANRSEYPRYRVNSTTSSYGATGVRSINMITYALRRGSQNSQTGESSYVALLGDGTASNAIVVQSGYPVTKFGISGYYTGGVFDSNFNIKVWRLVE